MKKFLIIADDFTGSNDTGVQLTKRNIKTNVGFALSSEDVDAFVLDTESRNIFAQQAYDKVKGLLGGHDFSKYDYVLKKIDSTLRGNLGEELRAVDQVYQPELIIFIPAFPDLGRTTVDGVHYLNDVKITETEIAKDPVKPVKEDNLVTILKDTFNEEVTLVDIKAIENNTFDFNSNRLVVCDSTLNSHMQGVINAVNKLNKRVLWVGSAGIADNIMSIEYPSKPSFGLVGSLSEVSQKQLNFAMDKGVNVISVPIHDLLDDKDVSAYVKEAFESVSNHKDTIVCSSASLDRNELDKTLAKFNQMAITKKEEMNEHIQDILGQIVKDVLNQVEIAGLFITGGDTAIGFLNKIECSSFLIIQEIATGVPLMKISDGPFKGLSMVTKAGAFGNEDTIYYALKKLKEPITN